MPPTVLNLDIFLICAALLQALVIACSKLTEIMSLFV